MIAIASRPNLVTVNGKAIMQRMQATKEFYELDAKARGILENSAVQEEAIYNKYNMRGSTAASAANAANKKEESLDAAKEADAFLHQCGATATENLAEVVERRPIAGAVKVRLIIAGTPGDVWTQQRFLR